MRIGGGHGGSPGEICDRIHHEGVILAGDPAGEEQRLCLIDIPLEHGVAAHPDVLPRRVFHLVAQVVHHFLAGHQFLHLFPVQLPMLRKADPLGPLVQQAGDHIAGKAELIPHVVGNIIQIPLGIPKIEIGHGILAGDRVEHEHNVVVCLPQEMPQTTVLFLFPQFHSAGPPAVHPGNKVVGGVVLPLVLVHDPVGLGDERVQTEGFPVRPRIPHRNMALIFPDAFVQGAHIPAEGLLVAVTEHRHELIAARAVDPGGFQRVPQQVAAMADQLVPRVVPPGIVGLLEPGDVTVDHAGAELILAADAVL